MTMLEGDQLNCDDAAMLADALSILADIEQSNRAASLVASGEHAGDITVYRALYESAMISYRRAFDSGGSRIQPETGGRGSWKLSSDEINDVAAEFKDSHDEILYIAGKCVAHRAIPDARQAEVVANAPKGEPLAQTKYTPRKDLMPNLIHLTKRFQTKLMHVAAETAQKLGCTLPSES